MENRDRDKVSRNDTSSTEPGDLNRETPSRIGNERSENLDEPNRRSDNVDDSGMQGISNEH